MSAASRQHTCAACGHPFQPDERTNLEPLVDDIVRYVATCWTCITAPDHTHEDPTP
jgi:hypothetical protein